ncbi:MAG: carbohydrate ABC transporter permease, partial [Firmicutes bacterium]|nr:carbohydrate ABC transporter permease [Bacillota bacterium]
MTLLTLLAGFFAVLFLLPTVLTITNSFMSESELSANYGKIFSSLAGSGSTYVADTVNLKFIPDMVTFKQYWTVLLQSPEYLFKFWNSVILVVPIVLGQLAVAALASYSLMRYHGRFRDVIFFMYVILMLMPYQVMLVPNYLVAEWTHLLNTRWSIILPGIFTPFSVFLLTKFMRRIPKALIEAALLDGATEWQLFTKVCLPQCRSALYSVAILSFIDYWNMVEQPLIMLSDSDLHPLSVFLSQINTGEVGLAF